MEKEDISKRLSALSERIGILRLQQMDLQMRLNALHKEYQEVLILGESVIIKSKERMEAVWNA